MAFGAALGSWLCAAWLALLLLARAVAVQVLHQALLADGVDLAVADQLGQRLAQLVGQLAAVQVDGAQLIGRDRLGDLIAVRAFLVARQHAQDGALERVLLGLAERLRQSRARQGSKRPTRYPCSA